MAEQEFLASFGVEIEESGLNRLQQALQQNRELAEKLAAAFDQARSSVEAFFQDLSEISLPNLGSMPGRVTEEQQGITLPFSLDFTKANKELAAFFKEAGKSFRLNADGSGIVSAGRNALTQLQTLFSSTVLPLQVGVQETTVPGNNGNSGNGGNSGTGNTGSTGTDSGGNKGSSPLIPLQHAVTGGRFDEPTKTEIAEDGDPEYVIPVKKEPLAVPLLRQLTGELSDEARETLQEDLSDQTGAQDIAKPERLDAISGSPDAVPLREYLPPLSGSIAVESANFPERREVLTGSVPAGENILQPRVDAMPGSPSAESTSLPERLDPLSGSPIAAEPAPQERTDNQSGSSGIGMLNLSERMAPLTDSPDAAEPASQKRADNQSGSSGIGMLNLSERMDALTGSPDLDASAFHHRTEILSGHPDPGTPALLDRADSLSGSSAAESSGSSHNEDSLSGSPVPGAPAFPDRADELSASPDAAPDTFPAVLLTGSPAVSNYPQAESLTGSPDVPMAGSSAQTDLLSGSPDVPMAGSSAQSDLLSGAPAQSTDLQQVSTDSSSSFINLLASARNTLQQFFSGLQEHAGMLSGLPDLLASANAAAAPVVNNNSSNSVQAPVSIEVHAAGSDPESVGRSIYDVTEQYLLRTLSSAMG